MGKVYLAGAGPGDAGLLTVRARELMETADVVVYDALVSVEILCQIPAEKELIYVGKRSGHHSAPQEEINRILLREARAGKQVLRLKGGDPFVFGRGGEEVEALVKAKIPFEVVPGVTSAAAVPAYAGIPVTHRDYASSFHVITGHPRGDGSLQIDYPSLVQMDGTLVFLMGVSSMDEICRGLLGAGMCPDMPAAVLENGTTAGQRQVVSDVAHLAEEAKQADIHPPAIFLVGKVCAVADTFSWAGKRRLAGRQFLVTRPRQQCSRLAGRLRSYGAHVLEVPAIRTKPIIPNPKLSAALESFATDCEESWLVFTSPAGVRIFFEQLADLPLDLRTLFRRKAEVRIAAIGSATAGELRTHGWKADLVPERFDAESLGKELAGCASPESEILILRAKNGSKDLLPPLTSRGLHVQDVAVYETETRRHENLRGKIQEEFDKGAVDAVVFTSRSTVHGFAEMMGKDFTYRSVTAVCIGEQTADEAKKYGMPVKIATQASMDAIEERILEIWGQQMGEEIQSKYPEEAEC